MLVFECGDHDDFESEKFSAFVPMRMLYHTQYKWQGLLVFVHLSVCVCASAVKSTAQIVLVFLALLCFCVFLSLYTCVFVYSPACVSRRML